MALTGLDAEPFAAVDNARVKRACLTVAPGSANVRPPTRRGGGAAERAGFENRSARKGRESSNLSLSAAKLNGVRFSLPDAVVFFSICPMSHFLSARLY